MDFVIDVQGFKAKDGGFLAKEIAVLALHHSYIGHWIISPPYAFTCLEKKYRKQNNWLSRYHHGIEWHHGATQFDDVVVTLRSIARNAGRLFTRGRDKAEFLMKITSREIINLEDNDKCPSLKRLTHSSVRCAVHATKHIPTFICALNVASSLKSWILSNSKIEEEEEEEEEPNTHEQSSNSECSAASTWSSYYGCLSGGQDTEGLDETDGSCD